MSRKKAKHSPKRVLRLQISIRQRRRLNNLRSSESKRSYRFASTIYCMVTLGPRLGQQERRDSLSVDLESRRARHRAINLRCGCERMASRPQTPALSPEWRRHRRVKGERGSGSALG